jgi:nitrite reductase/ring-hydroxylating ferredoxin subunit/DMSO/TMAO reductase YedYZ heme-binding membrane subunit
MACRGSAAGKGFVVVMSTFYRAVGWNRQKQRYDEAILIGVVGFLIVFIAGGFLLDANATVETLIIRACGTCAALLLHVVLAIGPLCRLDARFLPLLYNRRHLGVTTFLVALVHGVFSLIQFHALGNVNPLVSVLVTSSDYTSLTNFPFQQLGLAALVILFVMAATSHDFWLRSLSPAVWKALHMLVYAAYALVIAHVALGALQAERHAVLPLMLFTGMTVVLGLHVAAAVREARRDVELSRAAAAGFVDVCSTADIVENRGRTVCLSGERVAVFRYEGKVSAVSNVCKHQNGPLGEGKIVGGCIVCPWHGYEYEPASGRAPAPFTERLPTFSVRVIRGRVLVNPVPHPPGTQVEPAFVDERQPREAAS